MHQWLSMRRHEMYTVRLAMRRSHRLRRSHRRVRMRVQLFRSVSLDVGVGGQHVWQNHQVTLGEGRPLQAVVSLRREEVHVGQSYLQRNHGLSLGPGRALLLWVTLLRLVDSAIICSRLNASPAARLLSVKLSQKNGDVGVGRLEVYHAEKGQFMPACISHWKETSAKTICAMLGYTWVICPDVPFNTLEHKYCMALGRSLINAMTPYIVYESSRVYVTL